MGHKSPKQFLLLAGRPVLMHTLKRWDESSAHGSLVLVLPDEYISEWTQLCLDFKFTVQHTVVAGGTTRFHSVLNGLAFCPGQGLVAIHDGVRPFASVRLIEQCFGAAALHGASIPVGAITSSLRQLHEHGSAAVNRANYRTVQTPQCFDLELIKQAYDQAVRHDFTDDAAVAESAGHYIALVEGETTNIKLTEPFDMAVAEAILAINHGGKA